MVRCVTICRQIKGKFTLCLMALILTSLSFLFCALEYNWSLHMLMLLVINTTYFSSFIVIKEMETNGEGTKFQCKVWPILLQFLLILPIYESNFPFSFSKCFWNFLNTVLLTFNSKLVGITDVVSPEGVDMCTEAFRKLKVQYSCSWVMLIHILESKFKFIFCQYGNYKLCYIS